jgi:hypothetical protein
MRMKILTITLGLCFSLAVVQTALAQGARSPSRSSGRSGSIRALAPTSGEQSPTGQYSAAELDQFRTQLLDLTDAIQQFGAIAPPDIVDLDSLTSAKAQIQAMTYPQLNTLRQGISPSKVSSRLQGARQAIAEYQKTRVDTTPASLKPRYIDPSAFPTVSGFCGANGPNRIPTGVMLAADIVFFIADSVRELAQDACKQDVLGENTSLACVIVDTIWIVAKGVDEGLHFCDDDLTGNVIDTNYARLDDVHTDVNNVGTTLDLHLNNADTHLTNVNNQITSEFLALDTHLTNVDNHVAAEFVALDAHIVTLVSQLSTQIAQGTALLSADLKQVMKLELTPEGQRQIVPAILTCTGTNCPNVLALCPAAGCSWNNVGPLP